MSAGWVALLAMFAAAFALGQLMRAESQCPWPAPGDAAVCATQAGSRSTEAFPGAIESVALVPDPRLAGVGVQVEVIGPDRAVLRVVELTGPAWVGSSEHCLIRLDGDGVEPLHARLTPLRGGKVRVEGYAENSGVYVEDQPVPMHPVAEPGEVIGLVSANLRVARATGEDR